MVLRKELKKNKVIPKVEVSNIEYMFDYAFEDDTNLESKVSVLMKEGYLIQSSEFYEYTKKGWSLYASIQSEQIFNKMMAYTGNSSHSLENVHSDVVDLVIKKIVNDKLYFLIAILEQEKVHANSATVKKLNKAIYQLLNELSLQI